jgi:hypothetical protein
LARQFDFSGGQIENVVRKNIIKYALSDSPAKAKISADKLTSCCKEEAGRKTESAVGFAIE